MSFERYTANTTGFEIRAYKGGNFQPRGYCDDPLGGVYTTKDPVTILTLSPIVQLINTNIAWDISGSISATGTIDTFDISWGGTTDIGDLSSQDWSMDPTSGNVQYTTVGQYTVTAYTTDTLGNRSAAAKRTVFIVKYLNLDRAYIATSDSRMFTLDPDGTMARPGSLAGVTNNFGMGRLNPHYIHMPSGSRHYVACTPTAIVYAVDDGTTYKLASAASFGDPTNTAGDGSPPTASDLDSTCVFFDPQTPRRMYVVRSTNSTWNASNDPRVYLYWSDDWIISGSTLVGTWYSGGIGNI